MKGFTLIIGRFIKEGTGLSGFKLHVGGRYMCGHCKTTQVAR
jgi:hypothetical protein